MRNVETRLMKQYLALSVSCSVDRFLLHLHSLAFYDLTERFLNAACRHSDMQYVRETLLRQSQRKFDSHATVKIIRKLSSEKFFFSFHYNLGIGVTN